MFVAIIVLGAMIKQQNMNYSDFFPLWLMPSTGKFVSRQQEVAVLSISDNQPKSWSYSYWAGQCPGTCCCLVYIFILWYHLLFISNLKIHRNAADSCFSLLFDSFILFLCRLDSIAWVNIRFCNKEISSPLLCYRVFPDFGSQQPCLITN